MFTRIVFAVGSAIPTLISLAFWGLLLQLESIFSRKTKAIAEKAAGVAPQPAAPSPARQRYSNTLQSLQVPADAGTDESRFRGWVIHRTTKLRAVSPAEISTSLHPSLKPKTDEKNQRPLSIVAPAALRSEAHSEASRRAEGQ